MAKSTRSAFNDMKKSYNKAMKSERKRNGLPVNKKHYYWEKYSAPKSKTYKASKSGTKYIDYTKQPANKKPDSKNNQNTNGCYIATCVYGSYDCPEVWTLRRFRDYTLDETWYGRLFIKFYYAVSPTVVRLFGKQIWFKRFWKKHLNNLVNQLNRQGVEATEYKDKY